ncbi:hypothetical protein QCM77_19425 [Bradyrhizobium sp. SSUT18]|uniref:hypothetical protein n=1 Tax=Bradyrhizobium sp. SSUT18 TaxID=3040602 RepID=UPI00244B0DBE|nr:hypothetical protein [Bradyrhizobium sp. SSUT18]MDH2402114.1 hypothetical protein [Bradyrhizobium sp. SSUT18]
MTEAEEAEVMQLTKDLMNYLSVRNVPLGIASAALIQLLLEIQRRRGEHGTLDEAARELIQLFQRAVSKQNN